tara:strand:+ start:2458 stop:8340 length:5883 start_codon:yes stop_codon:yes gene_type:complete
MKKFVKGMHKDSGRVDQPPNTYRDALNANLYYTKGAVTNEEGNSMIGGVGMDVIGSITLLDNQVLLFALVDDVSTIILVFTKRNVMQVLYRNAAMNFQKEYPITGEFRVDAKNDTIVYFTDNYHVQPEPPVVQSIASGPTFNPPRAFNVSRQVDHIETQGNSEILYDADFSFDVNKLNVFPEVGRHSIISRVNIKAGGALPTGAYQLALAYSDENFLETDYFVVSNAVYIIPQFEEALPVDSVTGAPAGTPTNKSIVFDVQCFTNNNYTFLQPAIIKTVGGSTTAVKLERTKRLTANGGVIQVSYTGLEDATPAAVEDILIDKVKYDTAKSLSQLDNRLYLANLRSRKDIGYQRFANEIKIEPIQKAVLKFDNRVFNINSLNQGYAAMLQAFGKTIGQTYARKQSFTIETYNDGQRQDASVVEGVIRRTFFEQLREHLVHQSSNALLGTSADFIADSGSFQDDYNLGGKVSRGHKNYRLNWKHKSYRRGEVYAFYISFILKDGSETFAYHIPGRAPVCPDFGARVSGRADLDTEICEDATINNNAQQWQRIEAAFEGAYPSELAGIYGPGVKVYQFADTSLSPLVQTLSGGKMGYWENENEKYPFNLDFKNKSVFYSEGVSTSGSETSATEDLRGQNVRHHKMPSNLGEFSFVETADEMTDGSGYNSFKGNQDLIDNPLEDGGSDLEKPGLQADYRTRDIVNRDKARILGVRLDNIRIPKTILSQVRGYKVYYAKRKQEDKTILGQSMAIPAQPRYASVDVQSRLIAKQGPYKNGFYLYGGLTHTDDNHMSVYSSAKEYRDNLAGSPSEGLYVGDPVFTFHDFQLLRDKPDLTAATHITCQYATFYRAFQGGPGVYAKTADLDGSNGLFAPMTSSDNLYDSGGQFGTAARVTVFPSLGWIHPDLGNTTNFNKDGQIYDITDVVIDKTEDVTNPYGFASSTAADDADGGKRRRGMQRPIADNAEDIKASEFMVRAFKGQVNVAAGYLPPGVAMGAPSVIKGGSTKGSAFGDGASSFSFTSVRGNWTWSGGEYQRENFWMYAIDPGSKKYVRGKVNNSVPDSSSFQGASILYNRGGESSLAIGLVSGLPHLKGVRASISNTDGGDYGFLMGMNQSSWENLSKDIVQWSDDNHYLFPDAPKIPTTTIPSHIFAQANRVDDFPNTLNVATAAEFRGLRYGLEPNNQFHGLPMSWMVNINAIKTDVFNPLDRQELVWTGYYKEIEDVDLDTGIVTDLDSNDMSAPDTNNYYDGTATSGFVFGGDTFITRYGFRTTSQSYGHTFFRGSTGLGDPGSTHSGDFGDLTTSGSGGIKNKNAFHLAEGTRRRFQGDIPNERNAANAVTKWGKTNDMQVWFGGGSNADLNVVDGAGERSTATQSLLGNSDNFVQGTVDPVSTIFSFLCESDINIGFRHGEDKEKGVDVKYFDRDTASEVLFDPPTNDHTEQDKLLYNDDYSLLNEKKVARAYPKRKPGDENIYEFATRVIRSKPTGLFIGDKYREFLANDFRDIPKNRGDIWDIYTQNGQLILHTERSLFMTRGKEELQISAATAFVGSGNIFTQDPGEALETALGHGGTKSILSGISTPFGRFWVSQRDFKCYMFQGGVKEISMGMESWFRENMPYQVEQYGINLEDTNIQLDAPTSDTPFGFTSGYDPKYKRILVTKKEMLPTDLFLSYVSDGLVQTVRPDKEFLQENFTAADVIYQGVLVFVIYDSAGNPVDIASFDNSDYFVPGGWTLSYYPELETWGSRHSYLPKMYASTPENFYSFNDTTMWEHSNNAAPGSFYGTTYPFEFEFIDNSAAANSKVFSSIAYWADVVKKDGTYVTEYETRTIPGFTSFYTYNSTQISSTKTNINYLSNARLVDKFWYINSFRDFSRTAAVTNSYINTGTPNVVGQITQEIVTTSETEPMFTSEGVVNSAYVDTEKLWHERRRFVDHYLGVRLSNDNSSTNLLYLYAAGTKFRQSLR